MERQVEHIVAVVEDLLRSVPVVIVDIEDGGSYVGIGKPLRRNGDVVQIAIAAEEFPAGMVTRRARERESCALPVAKGEPGTGVRAPLEPML